jgi:hypothetical protein
MANDVALAGLGDVGFAQKVCGRVSDPEAALRHHYGLWR